MSELLRRQPTNDAIDTLLKRAAPPPDSGPPAPAPPAVAVPPARAAAPAGPPAGVGIVFKENRRQGSCTLVVTNFC